MKTRIAQLIGVLLLWTICAPGAARAGQLTLTPTPLQVKWSSEAPAPLSAGEVAIVVGKNASEPERQAARLFRESIAKRFRQEWPIVKEGEEQSQHKILVVLGQPATCERVRDFCGRRGIELKERAPGRDAYAIEVYEADGKVLAVVAGANGRAVEYGQDTLSQLFTLVEGKLVLLKASIQDDPVVPLRGRPQTQVSHYLRPGELDLYVLSRVNFLDLRGGIYAFDPGAKLDHAEIGEAVKQAHARGLIVYGTVNCGVTKKDYEQVLGTFRELLDLGADGLWLSFDDKGPGEDPVKLTQLVIELGKQRKIEGHLIAITPPKGSYQKIETDFNRKIVGVPGMENATWFWTGVPSTEALAQARSIGLNAKPGWWHNWPRLFTPQTYVGIPPPSLGWSAPENDVLAAGGDCVDAVMPWGGNGFGQYFIVPVIGWWGWNPAGYDWPAVRRRIDALVFGEAQAETAMQFDDDLQKLSRMFSYASKDTDQVPLYPPRLRDAGERPAARALTVHMDQVLNRLTESDLSSGVPDVKTTYLQPMRRELETHQAAAELDYPEEWWPAQQREILNALYAADGATVSRLTTEGKARVHSQLEKVQTSLPGFQHVNKYVDWWKSRAGLDRDGWNKMLADRKKELQQRVHEYNRQISTADTMLGELRSPPLEWGIGRWQFANRLLATVAAGDREWFWGDWLAGTQEYRGMRVAVFAADRKTPGEPGEYAELEVTVPVSGRRDRLGLLLFASCINKDLFSNTPVKFRWAGYRFMQLRWGERVVWETDLGQLPERGNWFMVPVPMVADGEKELKLRLRVEDRKLSQNNFTIAYVGPLRLMQLP